MGINFIGLFEKSAYGNIYIYNLVDYFSKHIYPHPTPGASGDNIILSFDYYLQFNFKPCAVYMNAGMHFTSQKLCIYI